MLVEARATTAFRPWLGRGWTYLLAWSLALPAFPQAFIQGIVETIEDDERQPVAEAAVRAFVSDEAVAVAWSDREGRYTLDVPATSFELRLAKPGYVVARAGGLALPRLRRSCSDDCGQVDFLLERAAAFEVWLADPSGDPFPRVRIRLTSAGADDSASRQGRTDDRGAARFHGLAPGRYRLDFRPEPGASPLGPLYELDSTEVELRPGENPPLHRSARRAGSETFSFSALIEGIDFDNRPQVLIVRPLGEPPEEAFTLLQLTPELVIPRLPRGEYVLELRPMASRTRSHPYVLGRFRIDEDRAGVLLHAAEPGIVVGHVAFEDEAPDRVDLAVRSDEGWTWRTIRVERRFPNFTLDDAPAGTFKLEAAGPDFFLIDPPSFQLAEGVSRAVQVTVSARFGRVAGRVRGVADEDVRIELAGPEGAVVLTPGRNGAFVFDRLRPGAYGLCAAAGDAPCAADRVRRFTVEPGDEIEIELGAPR